MGLHDRIQNLIPVSKAELNIIFVVIIGLSAINIANYINGNTPSQETKAELIALFDSLTKEDRTPQLAQLDTFKIDIRTADKFQLQKLSGIGPKTAEKIIEYRRDNQFQNTEDIQKIKGIGPKTYQKMLPHLILFGEDPSLVTKSSEKDKPENQVSNAKKKKSNGKININTASLSELKSLPGIGETYAKRIIEYRENSPFTSIEQITYIKGIGEKKFEKLKDFIEI